jgi:hypothetical protein
MANAKKGFCTLFLLCLFLGATTSLLAQGNAAPISSDEIRKWILDDAPKAYILQQIKKRKVNFPLTTEIFGLITKDWKTINEENLPADLSDAIRTNYFSQKATLQVACPRECRLLLGNKETGTAAPGKSFKIDLDQGDVTITAVVPGFREQQMRASIKPGIVNLVSFNEFTPLPGGIKITAEPANCEIFINDKEAAPEQLASVAAGTYTIRAKAKGWATKQETVQVLPGQISDVHIRLGKLMDVPSHALEREQVGNAIRTRMMISNRDLFEPYSDLVFRLNYEAQGDFKLTTRAATLKGRITETVANETTSWQLIPDFSSGYGPITVSYVPGASPQIIKCAEKDMQVAQTFLTYIKKIAELNPYAVMKRLSQGGGTTELEWWDESSMKPFAGNSSEWWKEGSLKLIATYPDQVSKIRILKNPYEEFIIASEILYQAKGRTDIARVEYDNYRGLDPYWPQSIRLYSSPDFTDVFEIQYDDNSPRTISRKKPAR